MSTIAEVVKLKTGYANFVNLKEAFSEAGQNTARMEMYRPTPAHRKAFQRLCKGLYTPLDKKFCLLSGSYGTGKSHLSLMFANFLAKSSADPSIKAFLDNYAKLDAEQAKKLRNIRKDGSFLVAICDYDSGLRFEDIVLKAVFDACSRAEFDGIGLSRHAEAERILAQWQKSYPDRYAAFSKALEKSAPGVSTEQLRQQLKDTDSAALDNFTEAYRDAQGGIEFQPQAGNLVEITRHLVQQKEFKQRFKGLAILFDEFGFTLEKAAYSKDVLQGFMEKICQDLPNVIFVGCIHKDFKAYADRFSQDDANVMTARLTQVDLLAEGIEEIIGAIVETEKDSEVWKKEVEPKLSVFDQLVPMCKTLNLFPWIEDVNHIRQRVLEDIYGVHPMALSCLLKLSTEIGSDARSTFTFFSGDVGGAEGSYAEFIKIAEITVDGGKLRLFTTDQLYNFFRKELSRANQELRDNQRVIVNGYYNSVDALRKSLASDLFDEKSDARLPILRALLVLHLCEIPATLENVQFTLYCLSRNEQNQVKTHLASLDKCGAVFLRPQSKTYELASSGGEDPRDLIALYKKNIDLHPKDLVAALLEEVDPKGLDEFLEAKQYNLTFSEDKRYLRRFIRAKDVTEKLWTTLYEDWQKVQGKEANSYEGVIVYALCEDEAEVKVARAAAKQIPHSNFALAVPHDPQPFGELLLNVKACRHYLPPNEIEKISAQTESRLRDMLENPDDGYLPQLRRIFSAIVEGEHACFYRQGGDVLHDKPKQAHKPADILSEQLFSARTRIKHPDLNLAHDEKWRSGKNTPLKQAVEILLEGERVFIDNANPDSHGEMRYLKKVLLTGAGALKKVGNDGNVTYFECETNAAKISDDYPVLKALCKRVEELESSKTFPVASFTSEARSAPYGASGNAITLAVAHVIRAFGERLRIYSDSTTSVEEPVRDYADLIRLIGNPAAKTVFQLREVSKGQRKWIEEIAQAVGAPPLLQGQQRTLAQVFTPLQTWWDAIKPVARIVDLYAKEKQARPKQLESVLQTIKNADRFDLLLQELPSIYAGEPVGDNLSEKDAQDYAKAFREDIKLLESGVSLARNRVATALGELFGNTSADAVQCASLVEEWFKNLSPQQRDQTRYHNHSEAESVVACLVDANSTFDKKLFSTIPAGLGLDQLENWQTLKTKDYVAKWKQAKAAIEAAAVFIPAPQVTKTEKAQEVSERTYKLDQGGYIELSLPEGATQIIYTLNGEDPKISSIAQKATDALVLKDVFNGERIVTVTIRAADDVGNYSDLAKLQLINKLKEYEVTVKKDDLYVAEASFEFPKDATGLKAVLTSLLRQAVTQKIITAKQAGVITDMLDQHL